MIKTLPRLRPWGRRPDAAKIKTLGTLPQIPQRGTSAPLIPYVRVAPSQSWLIKNLTRAKSARVYYWYDYSAVSAKPQRRVEGGRFPLAGLGSAQGLNLLTLTASAQGLSLLTLTAPRKQQRHGFRIHTFYHRP